MTSVKPQQPRWLQKMFTKRASPPSPPPIPVNYWTPPNITWNDSDSIIESDYSKPVLDMTIFEPTLPEIACEVIREQPTLEQFHKEINKSFSELRAKFYVRNGRFAKQWIAAVNDAYSYGFTKQNRQVIAPTGQGKTFYLAALLRILTVRFPEKFDYLHPNNQGRLLPVVCVPAKVVAQTLSVFAEYRVLAIVTTLPSLRSSLGEHMLDWRTIIVNGIPQLYPFIKMDIATLFLAVDESQQVKNEDSTQSTIIESVAGHGIPTLFMSATPYSKVAQAKIIACAIQPDVPNPAGDNLPKFKLTNKVWPSFAKSICPPGFSPIDWSPAALAKLQFYLEPYTTRWAIPYEHKILTKIVSCRFATEKEREAYREVFEEWQEIRARRELDPLIGVIAELVALQKYNQRAEELRAPHLIKAGVELWMKKEEAHLKNRRVKPISVIFGFAHRTSMDIAAESLRRILGDAEFKKKVATICGGRDCDNDKDAFQADKKPFLLLTIASGGAGLSLDNNSRNRRQRYMFCSAVWNDIQMAQLAGRTQRLDTQSASYMYIMYYEGTEEYNKLQKVLRKVRCLKEVTTPTSVVNSDEGKAGTFVDDIHQLEYSNAGTEISKVTMSEDEEESAAQIVVGTQQVLEFEVDNSEEDDNNGTIQE